jgi:hypothetical protein
MKHCHWPLVSLTTHGSTNTDACYTLEVYPTSQQFRHLFIGGSWLRVSAAELPTIACAIVVDTP